MSNVDPGKWWVIFRSLDSSFKKGSFAWKEAVLAQSHNLDVQSFSKCAYPTWNLSLLEKLRAESWFSCLSGLEHPFFSATCKTLACQWLKPNATLSNVKPKPILFGAYEEEKNHISAPGTTPKKISCGTTDPSFASAQVYEFPAADTSPFLPPRV